MEGKKPRIIKAKDRAKIGAGPSVVRTVENGLMEANLSRMATKHKSTAECFWGITLNKAEEVRRRLPLTMAAVQKRHPLYRCKLGKQHGSFVFVEDPNSTIPIIDKERNGAESKTWFKVWREEVENVNMKLGDPFIKVYFLSDKGEDTCDVCFAVQHIACDGVSFATVLVEVMNFLSHETPLSSVDWGVWETSFCENSKKQLRSLYPGAISRWFTSLTTGVQFLCSSVQFYTSFPQSKGEAGIHLFRSAEMLTKKLRTYHTALEFSKEDTMRLAKLCHEGNTTVTALVSAAFLHAEAVAFHDLKKVRLFNHQTFFITSLRAEVGVDNTNVSPHIGSLPVRIAHRGQPFHKFDNATVLKTAQRYREQMQKISTAKKLWFAAHANSVTWLVPTGKNMIPHPTLVVSSFGRNVLEEKYDDFEVSGTMFAQSFIYVG